MLSQNKVGSVVLSLVLIVTSKDLLNTIKIDKLSVPELVQSGSNNVRLECQYTLSTDVSLYIIQWFFNDDPSPFYEWTPETEFTSNTIYNRYFNSTTTREHSILLLQQVIPEINGDYTCKVVSEGNVASLTKTMLVYSPESDFELNITRHQDILDIRCIAKGLYPQPELTLELNRNIIPKQLQRSWRGIDQLYVVESSVRQRTTNDNREITCRLYLPQADYTAIRKKNIIGKGTSNRSNYVIIHKMCVILSIAANTFIL